MLRYDQSKFRLPFPLVWYESHAKRVARGASQKHLRLADSVGEAAASTLVTDVLGRVGKSELSGLHAGFGDDGMPIIRTMGVANLRNGLDEIVSASLSSISPPAELRAWLADDAAQMRDLTAWFTVYYASLTLFDRCLITTDLADEREQVYAVGTDAVMGYSMAAADVVMYVRHNGIDMLSTGLFLPIGQDRQQIDPPPWT